MPDKKVFSDAFSPVAVQLWSLDMHLDIPTIPGRRRSNSRTAKARPKWYGICKGAVRFWGLGLVARGCLRGSGGWSSMVEE